VQFVEGVVLDVRDYSIILSKGRQCIFTSLLQERQPLQYVCHVAHWRDMLLAVGPGVLIPRPETEAIVDIVMDILQSKPYAAQDTTPRLLQAPWLDLGTGSGAHSLNCGAPDLFRSILSVVHPVY
jgi:methylase of polypeptide subunit release factors